MTKEDKPESEVLLEEEVAGDAVEAVKEVVEEAQEKKAEVVETKQKPQYTKHKDDRRGAEKSVEWVPKTKLGQDIVNGKYTSIDEVIATGELILEPEIVDYLIQNLKQEIVYVGGSPGKGGGIKRTATRITTRMHKSGRRYSMSSLVAVGNQDGVIGMAKESGTDHRAAIEKSLKQAKLNIIKIKRGCGNWECSCKGTHSVPFRIEAKHGSVTFVLLPAPKGVGIVADEESKKLLALAGLKDVWTQTYGQTGTRINLAFAVFEALKKLSRVKGELIKSQSTKPIPVQV
ncbi:MAG: 30S ribosomal protein S5 [Candidatus Aenigmarchaeota archaeon]|nr:30S ribosomal protein S5 [Candidatus Aenigmarchaeota archaeon]